MPSTTLVEDAVEDFFARASRGIVLNKWGRPYKPSMLRGYAEASRTHIVPFIGRRRLSDLTDVLIQEELVERLLGRGVAPNTVRNSLMPLRVVCRLAVKKKMLGSSPFHGVELPALTRGRWEGIDPDVVKQMILAAPEQDRALCGTAVLTGLRRGELQALATEHVDLRRNIIRVRRGWDRKAGPIAPKSESSVRDVPIVELFRPLLEAHIAQGRPKRSDLFFGRLPNRPFDPGTVADRPKAAWAAQDLPVLTFHQCRHAFASSAIAAKTNLKTLQRIMGHSSISVTHDVYGHLLPQGLEEFGAELDAHFR